MGGVNGVNLRQQAEADRNVDTGIGCLILIGVLVAFIFVGSLIWLAWEGIQTLQWIREGVNVNIRTTTSNS